MNWALVNLLSAIVAMVVDRRLGEPPAWAHPVVGMGRYLGWMGPALTALPPPAAWVGGAMAWLLGACMALAVGLAVELVLPWGVAQLDVPAWLQVMLLGLGVGVMLKPLLAWRMLHDEVAAVEQSLGHSLAAGRMQLQRLVSRDVTVLDATQVRESAIESLAENLNDSLIAPIFWFVVAGLPGAALYRFANTADAMWGYRGRYEWAGKWAARADDVLSWLPARLTAVLLCLAAGRWPGWQVLRAQSRLTPSPNGGWPMGTMALLLGVSLRKPGVYVLNACAEPPQASHTRQALRWAERAAWLSVAFGVLILAFVWCFTGGLR